MQRQIVRRRDVVRIEEHGALGYKLPITGLTGGEQLFAELPKQSGCTTAVADAMQRLANRELGAKIALIDRDEAREHLDFEPVLTGRVIEIAGGPVLAHGVIEHTQLLEDLAVVHTHVGALRGHFNGLPQHSYGFDRHAALGVDGGGMQQLNDGLLGVAVLLQQIDELEPRADVQGVVLDHRPRRGEHPLAVGLAELFACSGGHGCPLRSVW